MSRDPIGTSFIRLSYVAMRYGTAFASVLLALQAIAVKIEGAPQLEIMATCIGGLVASLLCIGLGRVQDELLAL